MHIERVVSYCPHFKEGFRLCNHRDCGRCDFGDLLRKEKLSEIPLFDYKLALRQTVKGGGMTWFRKYIILSPEALKKYGVPVNTLNQIAYAYDGSGCFYENTAGPVDVYLLADRRKSFTILRYEAYGIPSEEAVKRYDNYFFMGLRELMDKT